MKLNTAAEDVPLFVTAAAPVVVVPTATVAAAPGTPAPATPHFNPDGVVESAVNT